MYKIYMLKELSTHKIFYIGCTKLNLNRRLRAHKYSALVRPKCKRDLYIKSLLENEIDINIELLEEVGTIRHIAFTKEAEYITKYKNITDLVNETNGGLGSNGYTHSEDTKLKLKYNIRRRLEEGYMPPDMTGYKHSEETKQKIRESNIGKSPSEETREKLRIASTGKKHSSEAKLKISNATSKNVYQYSYSLTTLTLLKCWKSASIASETNINWRQDSISNVCIGKTRSHGGYYWSFNIIEDNKIKDVLMNIYKGIAVAQYSITDGTLIQIYESTIDAANKNKGFYSKPINAACRGTLKTYKNYIWKKL